MTFEDKEPEASVFRLFSELAGIGVDWGRLATDIAETHPLLQEMVQLWNFVEISDEHPAVTFSAEWDGDGD